MSAKTKRHRFAEWGRMVLALAIISAASSIALTGCGQSPTNQQEFDYSGALDLLHNAEAAHQASTGATGASLAPFAGVYDTCVSQEIGPSGGELRMWLGGHEISFNVPANALDSIVTITICGWTETQPRGEVFVYDCEPSGLQFDKPMLVRHPVSVAGVKNSVLFYNDGSTVNWRFEDVQGVQSSAAIFDIHHFSGYGISNRRTGP